MEIGDGGAGSGSGFWRKSGADDGRDTLTDPRGWYDVEDDRMNQEQQFQSRVLKGRKFLWPVCLAGVLVGSVIAAEFGPGPVSGTESLPWWKGNLHTHSLWSDGDDFPEMIVGWYREHGYHFLVLSDHNVMQTGERWIDVTNHSGGVVAWERYRNAMDADRIATREGEDGGLEVRLATLPELDRQFGEPGRFLLLPGEEITDKFESLPIHLNAGNLVETIPPQGGNSVVEVIENNLSAVRKQAETSGHSMLAQLNHPNFGWALTPEDLIEASGLPFIEIYNGHPAVHNEGDNSHPPTEALWDIALTYRYMNPAASPIYGVATDDAHNYHQIGLDHSNPGRGWVVVRSASLNADDLMEAMQRGDFYASTGVKLRDIQVRPEYLLVEVNPERHAEYFIQFIGSRRDFNRDAPSSKTNERPGITDRLHRRIGSVFAEVHAPVGVYRFTGNELYVRARIISSIPKANPYAPGEVEMAWTQPLRPGIPPQ